MNDSELQKAINESGFPLQLGLQQLVSGVRGWKTILAEHPWKDPLSSEEKFIDLVLQQGQDYPVRLVLECKRARDTEWLFLREPSTYPGRDERLKVRARIVVRHGGGNINQWIDVPFVPGSPEAGYCVIRKNKQRSQELLERTAAEVVRATDCLAQQETVIYEGDGSALPDPRRNFRRVYVPVIVTTARLFICDAEYEELDVQAGEIGGLVASEVASVRFMKTLVSFDPRQSSAQSIEEFSTQSERSIVVVQAAHFLSFLRGFQLGSNMRGELRSALLG